MSKLEYVANVNRINEDKYLISGEIHVEDLNLDELCGIISSLIQDVARQTDMEALDLLSRVSAEVILDLTSNQLKEREVN